MARISEPFPVSSLEPVQPTAAHPAAKVAPSYDLQGGKRLASTPISRSKPALRLPIEHRVIASLDRITETTGAYLDENVKGMDIEEARIKALSSENALKMKEAAERMQSRDVWSLLRKAASSIVAAISTVFGIALFATGGGSLMAGALVASGILSIANLVCMETGLWNDLAERLAHENEDLREKLKVLFPAIVGGLGALIGAMGSGGAVLWAPIDFGRAAVAAGLTAVHFAQGIATIGSAVAESKALWSQAELLEIETKINDHQIELEQNASSFGKWMQQMSDGTVKAAEIIRSSMSNMQYILLRG